MMTEQSNSDREVWPGDPTRPTVAPYKSASDSKAAAATKARPT